MEQTELNTFTKKNEDDESKAINIMQKIANTISKPYI